jgi:hypothetical protein
MAKRKEEEIVTPNHISEDIEQISDIFLKINEITTGYRTIHVLESVSNILLETILTLRDPRFAFMQICKGIDKELKEKGF